MTVVLLHAGVCDRRMWDDVVPVLRDAGHAVVAPDLRGFGSRPAGLAPFTHSGDVLSMLDGLGVERAHLVGASFGGQVALTVASQAPDRVASLALLAAGLPDWDYADPELLAYGEAEEAAFERGDADAIVDLNVKMWARRLAPHDQEYVAEAQRRAVELDAEETDAPAIDLDAITAETLVAVGDQDVSDFVAIARHLAERLPGPDLRVVEGAGHLLALEQPAATSGLLADWLAER